MNLKHFSKNIKMTKISNKPKQYKTRAKIGRSTKEPGINQEKGSSRNNFGIDQHGYLIWEKTNS